MFRTLSAARARKIVSYALAGLLILGSLARSVFAEDATTISGVVHDASGAVVSDASVSLLNARLFVFKTLD